MFARLCLLSLLALAPAAHADDLAAVIRDYAAYALAQDPIAAGQAGDLAAARRWPDDSPAAVARRRGQLQAFAQRLDALSAVSLPPDQAFERDVLEYKVETALGGLAFDEERLAFILGDGFHTLADYTALNTQPRSTAELEAWVARLEALPAYYATASANLRRGIATQFTQSRQATETAIADLRGQLAKPAADSLLMAPFAHLPPAVPAVEAARLRAQALQVLEAKVRPAQQAAVTLLEREYLPAARTAPGIGTLPRGRAYYAWLVRRHTTTLMTPEEVHALGLAEVKRIRARMDETIASTGFKGSFQDFLAFLRSDPRFYVDAERFGEKASEIAKRADALLPRYFGTLPRLTYGVNPMPAGLENSSNGYLPGSPAQGVPGQVVYKPANAPRQPIYGLPAWVLHEGVPGHHLQIALSQELPGIPEYRRRDELTAYVEGWALYSEKLGEEMGIYRNAYEQFGRLSLEMWRACRLVIDTGMHVMGWTRDQAVACLRENSALPPGEIEYEVNRYISWPGQALGYKVGERMLVAYREAAEQRLGADFDLRAFHDFILAQGPVPMVLLGERIVHDQAGRRTRKAPETTP